jgi:ribosome-associated translation inhibitor RaiA
MAGRVQITFRNMGVSPALEEEIHSRAASLERFSPGILGCRVLLEVPHRHRQRGRPIHVRIELALPGEDVIVNHEPAVDAIARRSGRKSSEVDGSHRDAHAAIHQAFAAARRQLEAMNGARKGM